MPGTTFWLLFPRVTRPLWPETIGMSFCFRKMMFCFLPVSRLSVLWYTTFGQYSSIVFFPKDETSQNPKKRGNVILGSQNDCLVYLVHGFCPSGQNEQQVFCVRIGLCKWGAPEKKWRLYRVACAASVQYLLVPSSVCCWFSCVLFGDVSASVDLLVLLTSAFIVCHNEWQVSIGSTVQMIYSSRSWSVPQVWTIRTNSIWYARIILFTTTGLFAPTATAYTRQREIFGVAHFHGSSGSCLTFAALVVAPRAKRHTPTRLVVEVIFFNHRKAPPVGLGFGHGGNAWNDGGVMSY